MRRRLAALVTTVAIATVVTAAAPAAGAAMVSLRVESSSAPLPLFDGTVETLPHAVDGGDGSGQHPCWGPPGAIPAPTATGALDDAMREAAIPWRGNWDSSFRDFFIDRIGPYASAAPDRYWSLTVNGSFSAGGCLTRVADGDTIRFYYGPLFGDPPDTTEADDPPSGPRAESAPEAGDAGRSIRRSRHVAAAASRYLRQTKGAGEGWARLALALRSGEASADAAAAILGNRLSTQRADGSLGGDVNATAVAVLALERRNRPRGGRAADWLADEQAADGGLGFRPGSPSDVDTTSLATWALALAGKRAAALSGASFVRRAQIVDGGFPSLPGGTSNSQSTGLATVALRVAGLGPRQTTSAGGRSPLDYLTSLSRRDGSIAYDGRRSPTPVWTTAQALLGLTTKAKLLGLDASRAAG